MQLRRDGPGPLKDRGQTADCVSVRSRLPRPLTLLAFLPIAAIALVGFLAARGNVQKEERRARIDRTTQVRQFYEASDHEWDRAISAAGIAATLSDRRGHGFTRALRDLRPDHSIRQIALLVEHRRLHIASSIDGGRSHLWMRLTPDQQRAIEGVVRSGRGSWSTSAPVAGIRYFARVAAVRPGRAIYVEATAPKARTNAGIEFVVVANGARVAGNVTDRMDGARSERMTFLGGAATLRTRSTGALASSVARAVPWLILVVGLVVALAISLLTSSLRRRAEFVKERRSHEQNLRSQAHHDILTGIANRAYLYDNFPEHATAIMLDLDDFRTLNDSLGHVAGDDVLREAARRIAEIAGPEAACARLGSDEFCVVTSALSDEEAAGLAVRILGRLGQSSAVAGHDLHLEARVGIAHGSDVVTVLRNADIALNHARADRHERIATFDDEMLAEVHDRMALKADLELALERGELCLHYQPIVDIEQHTLVAVEGLIRWRHPTRGLLAPGAFIGLAEETGLINPIGRWVVEEACRQAREWDPIAPHLYVSVNVSGRQLADPGFAEAVRTALQTSGLAPERLILELTETLLISEAAARPVIEDLKRSGVRLAVDDFGSGFSSLDYLRRFPIDILKIDRSFVETLDQPRDAALLAAIVELAKRLGIATVAEGIETREQLAQVRKTGCDRAQGFLFAKPLEPEALAALVQPAAAA